MNKLSTWIIGIAVVLIALIIGMYVVTEKVTNRVIHKLQKEYSPSPYGPGFDPDKINVIPKSVNGS